MLITSLLNEGAVIKINYSSDFIVFAFKKKGEGVSQSGHFLDLTGVFFWKGCLNPKCAQKDMI